MRPTSIVNFERMMFFTLILGVVQGFLADRHPPGAASIGFTVVVQVITFALIAGLTLLVSRRRSKIAMWISIGLFLLGLPLFFMLIYRGAQMGSIGISMVQVVGQIVAYGLLFTQSAREWMRNGTVAA